MKTLLKNKTISNSVVTLIIRMIGVATLFGLSFLMTNNLSAQEVGHYEFARVALLTIATLGLIGTDQSILFFAGKFDANHQKGNLKHTYHKMLLIVCISSVSIVGLYALIPNHFLQQFGIKSDLLHVLTQCIYILPFYVVTILNTETLRAYNKVILSEWFRNIIKYVPVLIGVVCIMMGFFHEKSLLNWYLYGFIGLAFVTSLILIISGYQINTTSGVVKTKEIITTSYPMAISSFYTFLLMTIDVFLLGQYFNTQFVAYYAIAMKVMSILSLVIVAINVNFAPKIASEYLSNNKEELQLLARKAARFIAIINGVSGILLIIFAPFILNLFGANYSEALPAFYILIAVQILVSTFGLVPMYLNMTSKQHLFHKIMLAAVVINLVANLLLIPTYEIVGAAISYGITVLFWNIAVAICSYKYDKVHLTLWK